MTIPRKTFLHFGEAFRYYQRRSGKTQAEIADAVGISLPALKKWCQSNTSRPRYWEQVILAADTMELDETITDDLLKLGQRPPFHTLTPKPHDTQTQDAMDNIRKRSGGISALKTQAKHHGFEVSESVMAGEKVIELKIPPPNEKNSGTLARFIKDLSEPGL